MQYNVGDLIKYHNLYGIVTGKNEWFFYNVNTKKYRVAGIVLEYASLIDTDGPFASMEDVRKQKALLAAYKEYTQRQLRAVRNSVKDYEPGTRLRKIGKNNTWIYVYLGYGKFEHEEYGIHRREKQGHVYYKLTIDDKYFNFSYAIENLKANAKIAFEFPCYMDRYGYALYDKYNLKLTKNKITDKVEVIDKCEVDIPYKISIANPKDSNIYEILTLT